MIDTLQEIWGAIMRNKMRTAATGIAVASGIFLLIVLLGASNGIIHTLEQNSEGLSLDAVHIYPGFTSKPFNGIKEGRRIELDNRDIDMPKRRFKENVDEVTATVEQGGLTASVGKQHLSVTLTGVYPQQKEIDGSKLARGRFINDLDLLQNRKVVVIDNNQEEHLFGPNVNGIGKIININNSAFTVVGIRKRDFAFSSSNMLAPFTTMKIIYSKGNNIGELTLKSKGLDTEQKNEDFEKNYRRAMGEIHQFDAEDESAIWMWNSAENNSAMNTAKSTLHTAFWILGLLTLLSGVVGVSNIMLISVKERTHEFGIRKALGARPRSIVSMVIFESIIITTFFGYIGMLFGVGFCEWMDSSVGGYTMDMGVFQQKLFVNPTVDLSICIEATVVMIISGMLAGFFPAQRAAKVKPIEALHG